ncbi:MAG: sigma-70 family RNA polymerase sigma factor [Candidatus Chryseobacterium colombiense]|nr:sigma-70 family RNA polymerase sigma factor [Chryseobacterium sp.]WEK71520.1 MAG: sigma-70 family RNA polymerase sigma factor [Chryseobacterium sp.]
MAKIKTDWQKIYLDYSPKLLGICRRYIPDLYIAEDIIQDSFITAMQKDHQLHDEKALFGWLKKIVINNSLQYLRKFSKDNFINTEALEIPDTYSEMEHHSQEEKNIFIYDFSNEELLSSIDSLPPHHRSVFNLYFIENHSHAEIAGLLGITINTSKSHLLRAKKSIQTYLLNHIINPNTPKNKTAQLLVIFGLGGLLWAQTFRSKFSDFHITTSKKLEVPENITIKTPTFHSSQSNLKKKVIITSTCIIIIISSLFLLNTQNHLFFQNHSIHTDSIQRKNKVISENRYLKEKSDSERSTPAKTINSSIKTKQNKAEKLTIAEEKSIKDKGRTQKILLKDTIKETSQKVIIVKKIIKRDTIFVER